MFIELYSRVGSTPQPEWRMYFLLDLNISQPSPSTEQTKQEEQDLGMQYRTVVYPVLISVPESHGHGAVVVVL